MSKIQTVKELRHLLIRERKKQGLTQQELAVKMETLRVNISRMEVGARSIPLIVLLKWLDTLSLTMNIEGELD